MRREARADIAEAAAWYERREEGLGKRLTLEIVTAIDELSADPFRHRIRNRRLDVRSRFPKSFPYRIVYRATEEVVTVIGVIHAARDEQTWRKRL
jgi:plasmid stabilization system protein ParE